MFAENHSLGHIVLNCLKERPDSICLVDAATGEEETNISVLRRAIHLARCFLKIGLVPGDVLALSGKNHLDQHIPYFAALFNGLPICGIDAMYKVDEIKDIFKVVEPKIAFCEPEAYDDYVKAARVLGLDTKVFTFGKGEHSMENLVETYKDDTPIEEFEVTNFDKDKIYAWLVCSGGTTGVLKVAAIKHDAWKSKMSELLMHIYGMNKSSRNFSNDQPQKSALNLSSIQWISGMFHAISMPVMHQTKIQTSAVPTTEHVIDIINKYRPASAVFSPALATGILKNKKQCDLTCFRSIVLTGGKVFKDTLLGIKDRVNKNTLVIEAYGQTENLGPVFAANPFGPIGTCGVPYSGAEIKLVDPETDKEITEPHVTGELWTKGVGFSEYYNNPEETALAFTEDGWFKTGDLLYRDENNNYFFVERLKMLIKYRNYQIIPPEIESVIRTLDGVLEVSVTSIPHEDDGEHPVACVVRRPGAKVTAQEVKDVVASKLSETKQLRGGVVFMDELPLTHARKVARGKLRNLVQNMQRE